MDGAWIISSAETVIMVIISTLCIYGVLVLFTRLSGVRTFSKASSFDFAITIAIGSLLTTTVLTKDPALLQGIVALAMFFVIQMTVAWLRTKSKSVHRLVDNKPILLMLGT